MNLSVLTRMRLAEVLWGWSPHAGQVPWFGAEPQVLACGRRWGKTELVAVDAATRMLTTPGLRQMVVSPTYDQSRILFDKVESLMAAVPGAARKMRVVKTPYPRLWYRGCELTARTGDDEGRNLRGHWAHRVVVDEAAFVKEDLVTRVLRPMLADVSGELVQLSTPNGKNHFFRAFVAAQARGRALHSWTAANPFISPAFLAGERESLPERVFAAEYLADFTEMVGAVLREDDIIAAVNAEPLWEPVATVVGVDWGRELDWTVAAPVSYSPPGATQRFSCFGVQRWQGQPWDTLVQNVRVLANNVAADRYVCDATGVGDAATEMLATAVDGQTQRRPPVTRQVFTASSKLTMVNRLVLAFERRQISLRVPDWAVQELRYFGGQGVTESGPRYGAPPGMHDDFVCALMMALDAAAWAAEPIRAVTRNVAATTPPEVW